jgi:hypothetical protein
MMALSLPPMTPMHKGALYLCSKTDARVYFWVWIGTRLSTGRLAVRPARGHMRGRSGASLADQAVKIGHVSRQNRPSIRNEYPTPKIYVGAL